MEYIVNRSSVLFEHLFIQFQIVYFKPSTKTPTQTVSSTASMPKSTGPLQTQLFGTSSASTPGMADQTTSAADKLGANKGTDAIPQSVRLAILPPSISTPCIPSVLI